MKLTLLIVAGLVILAVIQYSGASEPKCLHNCDPSNGLKNTETNKDPNGRMKRESPQDRERQREREREQRHRSEADRERERQRQDEMNAQNANGQIG